MSLTSIRWPEKAKERTSSTTSCRLWIKQQEEIRNPRHRAGDVAQRDDLRLVAVAALPGGEERHAAPGGVASDACGERRDGRGAGACAAWSSVRAAGARSGGSAPHLLDLPRLDPRQRRIAQDLVAQVFGFLAPVQQQRLRDGIADRVAQAVQRVWSAARASDGLVAARLSRSSRSRSMPIRSRMRPEKMPRWVK